MHFYTLAHIVLLFRFVLCDRGPIIVTFPASGLVVCLLNSLLSCAPAIRGVGDTVTEGGGKGDVQSGRAVA